MNLEDLAKGMPMTQLLYQEDSYLKETSCNILKSEPDDRRSAYVILDRTIFHPKSGGQPSDKGKISTDGIIFDVRRVMMVGGIVIHWGKYVEGIPAAGPACLQVEWDLRYLSMRKHTAAHLYDHCLSTILGKSVETTDSWVGDDGYVGYRGRCPAVVHMKEAETMENEMIKKGAKVTSRSMTREEALSTVPDAPNIARLPKNAYLRVVTIAGCHGIPCGGTHLKDIHEIGEFSLAGTEGCTEGFRVRFNVSA